MTDTTTESVELIARGIGGNPKAGALVRIITSDVLRALAAERDAQRARIEQLERELAEARALLTDYREIRSTKIEDVTFLGCTSKQSDEPALIQHEVDGRFIVTASLKGWTLTNGLSLKDTHTKLSAEKALADRLYEDLNHLTQFHTCARYQGTIAAYRKARGV